MSKIQKKSSATEWFKNKFCNTNLSLNKAKADKKIIDFKTELTERLALRRHKEMEMRHNFYNVENEIPVHEEETEDDLDEELSGSEINSNESFENPDLEEEKENIIPIPQNEDEVKNIDVEEEKDDDIETYNDEDDVVEQKESSGEEEEDDEDYNKLSMNAKFVSVKKMYVLEDDEDEEKIAKENSDLNKVISIQSELTNETIGDLFTIEDDKNETYLNKSGDEVEDFTEDACEEQIFGNVEEGKQQNMKEMFDDEASLSGDDIGSDRDDADDIEGLDEYEAEEGDLDKLNDEEIRDNLIRQYNKYERDADDKRLLKLQEAFFADSDLHNHVGSSDRSFRFRMHTDSKIEWSKIFNIDDREGFNEEEDIESESRREKRLKMLEWQLEQHKKGIKRKATEIDNSDDEEEENGVDDQQLNVTDLEDDSNAGVLFQLGEQILLGKENELPENNNKLNEISTKNPLNSVQLLSSTTKWRKKDSLINGASNLEILFKNGDFNETSTNFGTENNFNSFFRKQNI